MDMSGQIILRVQNKKVYYTCIFLYIVVILIFKKYF